MQWYDPFLIMLFLLGVILIGLSHHKGKMGIFGFIIVILVLIAKTLAWILK